MQQHLLDGLLIARVVALHLAQHAQTAGRGLLLAIRVAKRLLNDGDLLPVFLRFQLDVLLDFGFFGLAPFGLFQFTVRLCKLFVHALRRLSQFFALRVGLFAPAFQLFTHGGKPRLAGAHIAQAVHRVDDGALMGFQLFFGLSGFFLCGLQSFFLLAELTRQLDDFRTIGERVPLVFRNFLIKRGAPGALHVLFLTEGKHVLFHAVDFRAQHAKLAFARFRFARQFQHRVMRGGHLVFELLRALVGFFALRAQLIGALFFVGNGLFQADEQLFRLCNALLGAVAAQYECRTFQHAQFVAKIQIAPRRFAGFFQRLKLAFQFGDDVFHAGEVVAHVRKALFAFFLARAVFDDARSLFKNAAPVLALLGEDFVDAALPDDGIALFAHARVAEKLDNILEPASGFVDVVFALAASIHAPGDDHFGIIHAQRMILVVKDERHFAIAHAFALLRAVEDDVLHLAAAQCLGALFAEHPAHRVGQIGFAAAVRPDNAGDAFVKDDDRAFRERLKAVNFQSFQPHLCDPFPYPRTRVSLSLMQRLQRHLRGGLFGALFARARARAQFAAIRTQNPRGKHTGMRRAVLPDDFVGRRFLAQRLQIFLQSALRVAVALFAGFVIAHRQIDQLGRLLHARVQIDGGDDRLHRIGKDRRVFPPADNLFAAVEFQIAAQPQPRGRFGQIGLTDQRGALTGQLSLAQFGILMINHAADADFKHRVAQKLKALVVLTLMLKRIGRMGHRQIEQADIGKLMADGPLQGLIIHNCLALVHFPRPFRFARRFARNEIHGKGAPPKRRVRFLITSSLRYTSPYRRRS